MVGSIEAIGGGLVEAFEPMPVGVEGGPNRRVSKPLMPSFLKPSFEYAYRVGSQIAALRVGYPLEFTPPSVMTGTGAGGRRGAPGRAQDAIQRRPLQIVDHC